MSIIQPRSEQEFQNIKHTFAPPYVIDFYADWCGPCKMIAPTFEALSNEVENASFIKLNIEECVEVAKAYGVRNIPTILVLSDFEQPPVTTIVGAKTPSEMKTTIISSLEKITNGN